jgi:hypothetical protein
MKFTKGCDINGTSLQGYVFTDYAGLVQVFGFPEFGPNDHSGDKVTCEWELTFADGTIATVYEWKHGYTPMQRTDWHIGGKSKRSEMLVQQAIADFKDPLYKMVKEYAD